MADPATDGVNVPITVQWVTKGEAQELDVCTKSDVLPDMGTDVAVTEEPPLFVKVKVSGYVSLSDTGWKWRGNITFDVV